MSSIANINGANPKRMSIEQFGSNLGAAVLQQPFLTGKAKYDVTIEDFYISSDIPIFPKGTKVFDIIDTAGQQPGFPVIPNNNVILSSCVIGPVYNWLDFAFQIQEYLNTTRALGDLNLEGAFIPQKNLSFAANATFWNNKIIYFADQFADIFEHRAIFARRLPNGVHRTNNTTDNDSGVPHSILAADGTYSNIVSLGFVGEALSTFSSSRMDLFENRHRIRIDSVLSLPHEMFAVNSKASHRYVFMEFDFPRETVSSRIAVQNMRLSDNISISQILHTGIFRLIKPSPHSGMKKLIAGQSQDHRYEIFIIRKKLENGVVKLQEEKFPMSSGDFFRLALLFTREV